MPIRRFLALAAAAALSLGATAPKTAAPAARGNWYARVVNTPSGAYVVGNPAAKVKLVEYVSYTCPHCAEFDEQSGTELGLGFIKPGTGSIEYRPLFRNILDVAATLLVTCGGPARTLGNHGMVLRRQDKWVKEPTGAQASRWDNGSFVQRMRAIAGDTGLYALFEARGYTRVQLDRCLANEAYANVIAKENQAAMNEMGVDSTPSFLINGTLQSAHSWGELRPLLMALTR